MIATYIDHITVTAPTLAAGIDYVRQALGVTPPAGGEHPRMGTHNCLLRLGAELFLEVIAVNPAAAPPGRPRWFQLDDAGFHCRPRLATWVARSDDIDAAAAAAAWPVGAIEPMARAALTWRITIPADGGMALGGVAPALIQWNTASHPAGAMADLGCSLLRLELCHPDPALVGGMLAGIGCQGPLLIAPLAAGAQPCLVAHIDTPAGPRRLGGGPD